LGQKSPLSPTQTPCYRVRDFSIQDCQPHDIRIDWIGSDNKPGNALLFTQNEAIPISKVLTFTRKDLSPFTIKASYEGANFTAFPEKHIGDYIVSDLKEPETPTENGSMKVKVKLRVDNNGLLVIPQAVQIDKKEVQEEIKEPMADPAADKKADDKPKEEAAKKEGDASADASDKPAENAEKTEEAAKEEMADEPAKPKFKTVLTLKPVKIELSVSDNISGKLVGKIVNNYIEAENELAVLDKKERDRQDAKNELESYIYDSRDKVGTTYSDFSTDQEKESLSSTLTKYEDWLYDDEGFDANKQTYTAKHNELKALIQPLLLRYNESNTRPPAIGNLLNYIQSVEKFISKFNSGDESISHIDSEKVKLVEKKLEEIKNWTNKSTDSISQMKKYSNPEILTSEFIDKLHDLKINSKNTMETPKPKPVEKKEEEENKPKEGENAEATEKNSGDAENNTKTEESAKNEPTVNGNTEEMDLD